MDVEHLAWSFMLPRRPRGISQIARSLAEQVAPSSLSEQILNAMMASGAAMTATLPATAAAEMALGAIADRGVLEDLTVTAQCHTALSALGYCERLDDYSEWAERRREHAARSGSRLEFRVLAGHRARIAWLRGELVAAVEEAREALEGTRHGGYTFLLPCAAGTLVEALVQQGELDEAEHVLCHHGLTQGITISPLLPPARVSLVLARGDIRRAREELSAIQPEFAALSLQMAPPAIAVALASGSADEAQQRAEAMLVAAERFGAPAGIGSARRLLGLAIGGTAGLKLLRSAVDALQPSARRLELARALVDHGAALRRHKHRAAARDPLRQGLDLAQRCGASTLAHRAAEELRATGARPRRLVLTGVESLTPSELRVARLVAQGRSNPEVATALFVTRATIETHLHSIFRKLDISSRDQLSAALAV
jgi:ATP/maltotriose-dependent transcriptional regulator MalT